jgi:hypothetical protein
LRHYAIGDHRISPLVTMSPSTGIGSPDRIVCYREADSRIVGIHRDDAARTTRMLGRIRQCLCDNVIRGYLDGLEKSALDIDATLSRHGRTFVITDCRN